MEHVLAEVGGPVLVRVLEVAGAVHEDDARTRRVAPRADHLGREEPRVDVDAVARLERDDLRVDPLERSPGLGRRRRDLRRRRAGRVRHHVHLRRLVAVGEHQAQRRLVRRHLGLIRAGHRRDLRARAAVDRQRVEVPLAGMLFARRQVELPAVARDFRRRHLPLPRRQLHRLRRSSTDTSSV